MGEPQWQLPKLTGHKVRWLKQNKNTPDLIWTTVTGCAAGREEHSCHRADLSEDLGFILINYVTLDKTHFTSLVSVFLFSKVCVCVCVCMCVCAHSRPTLCNPMDCSSPGCSVHGIFQARILEWVTVSCSRGSSWARYRIEVSCASCIGRQTLYHLVTRALKYKCTGYKLWAFIPMMTLTIHIPMSKSRLLSEPQFPHL